MSFANSFGAIRRRTFILSAVALLLMVAASFAWHYIFYTPAGINFVLQRINRSPRLHIQLRDVSGNLAGPIVVRQFELDEDHVHVSAQDVHLRLTPLALLAFTVRAESLSASHVIVQLKNAANTPPTKPLHFLPRLLRISVGHVNIDKPQLITANHTVIDGDRVRGSLSITSRHLRVLNADVQTPQYSAQGEVNVTANRPVGLKISATAHVPMSRGVILTADATLNGDADKLSVAGTLLTPALATFTGDLQHADGQMQMRGTVQSSRFGLEPWLQRPPFSLQNIHLQVQGALTHFKIVGDVNVPEVDTQPLHVSGAIDYAAHVLSIGDAVIRPSTTDISNTEMTTTTNAKIKFGGDKLHIDANTHWQNLRWPIRQPQLTSTSGAASIEGSQTYRVAVQGQLSLPTTIPSLQAQVEARANILDAAIAIDSYEITAPQGNARGSARLNFSKRPQWQLQTVASNLNPQAIQSRGSQNLFGEFPGRLNFTAQASGQGFDKRAAFELNVSALSGTLRGEKISGHGAISHRDNFWSAKNVSLALGANRLALNGTLGKHSDLTWSADIPALERFVSEAAGELHTHGALHGNRDAPQGSVVLSGKHLRFADWRAEQLQVDTNIDLATGHSSRLAIAAQQIGWREVLLEELHINSSGNAAAHRIELKGSLIRTPPHDGDVADNAATIPQQFAMTLNGAYLNKQWRGTLSALQLEDAQGNAPSSNAPPASAEISADEAHLGRWCALWRDKKLCASGAWQKSGDWHAAVDSDQLELGVFDGTFPQTGKYAGTWGISGQATGYHDRPWTGTVAVVLHDATLTYQPLEDAEETVQLGSGNINLNATATQLAARMHIATPGTTSLDANAHIERNAHRSLTQSPLNGELDAHTADANLLPVFFPDLDRAAGELHAVAHVTGSLATPQVNGDVDLTHGELDLYRYNLSLRNIGLRAHIDNDRIDFNGGAQAGDGKVDIGGQLVWRDSQPKGELHLQGINLLVADLPDYRVVASPDIKFAIDGKRIDLSGEVVIPSAHIQPVDVRGAVQPSPDARLVSQTAEQERGFQVHSEVRITLGDDVRLDTYGLQGKLRGSVTTILTPNAVPRGRGELSVSDGRYDAYGQKLTIEHGRLLFDASPLDDPGLDILADRDIEDTQKVGVNVRGTLRAPRMTLYADPSLPDSQIVSYLFTGKPLDDLKARDTNAITNASNELALQGGGLLASQLGRRIGLETVSVESNGLNDASLVLGKFLSPRLFVSYGISLTESINTLKLRYTISKHWRVKLEAGEYQSGDLEFRIER